MADGPEQRNVDDNGLLAAYVLDGRGGARRIDWDGVGAWNPADGPLWVHLHREGEHSTRWLSQASGLDPLTIGALLTSASRPRLTAMDEGLLLILRGANLNPDADPEDMISLRIWAEPARVVSLRRERFQTVDTIVAALVAGKGPRSAADLIVAIIAGLTERILPVVDELGERLDHIEEDVANPHKASNRLALIDVRRQLIVLHRHLVPQRQTMLELAESNSPLFEKRHRRTFREAAARLDRCHADLDAARARAAVIQDEIVSQQAEAVNKRVYTLTVVAVVFLPLTLFSGMLGMNVGGVPWAESAGGFVIASAALAAIGVAIVVVLRWMRWI